MGFSDGPGRAFWNGAAAISDAARPLHSPASITSPYDGNPLDLTIFVSCRNEEAQIVSTLDMIADAMQVVGKRYEILVIDDASQDQSGERVRGYIAAHPEQAIILRANPWAKGLAQNYLDGAFIGCGAYYCWIRGDSAESMETMVDILKNIGEADIIVPYCVARNTHRRMAAEAYAWFINLLSGHRINCYQGMQVHLRQNVMRWHPDTRGYGFQSRLLCRLLDLGFTCKQAPCRDEGRDSRLTWKHALSALHTALDIVLRRLGQRIYGR